MATLFDHYKVLGVKVGAGLSEVTSAYKQLCRIYHPDVCGDQDAEELMKQINIAYTALREKFRREAAFQQRLSNTRQSRRYGSADIRYHTTDAYKKSADTSVEAFAALHGYFRAINTFDYDEAYNYLSAFDRRHITRDSFVEWRKSVARLYPMREFKIAGGSTSSLVTRGDGRIFHARKFHVAVTEEDFTDESMHSGDVEKLVINENGVWGVYLGYSGVSDLTYTFDKRLEVKRRRDLAKCWDEFYTGQHMEYGMLNSTGMRKAALHELYRQQRYGGSITFAAISVSVSEAKEAGREELLRSAARTINAVLRESDIPGYMGDDVFAILMVELKKKNAEKIISRIADSIRKNAGEQLGPSANIEYSYGTWAGESPADISALNKVLKKFRKKM